MSAVAGFRSDLRDHVAVVTGAAHGIGLGIVETLLRLGARVMASDLDRGRLAANVDAISGGAADRVAVHAVDLSTESGADSLRSATIEAFGAARILVNCAGGGIIRPFLEHTAETLKATIDRNLWTALWCTRAFLPDMVAAGDGRIINIGADSVRSGLVDHAAYNAAKGGMHGLTTGLAREFAPFGITVNTVAPCVIRTEAYDNVMRVNPALARRFVDVVPLGRPGEIDEVASMVGYLALPEAGFVTGQVISVNGGSTMP